MDITKAFDEFLVSRAVYCAPETIGYYQEMLAYWIQDTGIRSTDEICLSMMQQYIIRLRRTRKNTTVRTYCRAVIAFVHWLEEIDVLQSYPFRGLKLPREDAEIIIPLTAGEVSAVMNTFDLRYHEFVSYDWKMWRNCILFLLLLDAGMRSSEVRHLKVMDVDLENRYFRIRQSKNEKSRIVPMSGRLYGLLSYYLPKLPDNSGYVLRPLRLRIGEASSTPISEETVKSFFASLKKESGVERIHAHLCRHTFATSFLYAGGTMEDLRLLLGHYDYSITKNYLHLSMEYKLTGADIYRLDPVFFRSGY